MTFKRVGIENDEKSINLIGKWTTELYGSDGKIKKVIESENVVCTNGKEFLASFLYSAGLAASTFTMKYIAIGSDNTSEVAGNTALGTELARQTGTVSYVSNQIFQVTATFATGSGTGNVYEYGILSSSTAGTLLNRNTQGLITKGASDTLKVVCQLTIS